MSPIRFTGALVVSLALIAGALWFRFVKIPPYSAPLITVTETPEFASDDAYLKDFLATSTNKKTVSSAPLSQEELVSRKMFSDYMSLKSSGQVRPSDINALADKYAQEVLNIEISSKKIEQNDILITSDTRENLVAYGSGLTAIRIKYKNLVNAQVSGRDLSDITSPAFSSFMSTASKLYLSAANELISLRTPVSLSVYHLNLINNYLENAEAMKLVSNNSKNPASAYAALNHYAKNTGLESDIFINIQGVLLASGILFNGNI